MWDGHWRTERMRPKPSEVRKWKWNWQCEKGLEEAVDICPRNSLGVPIPPIFGSDALTNKLIPLLPFLQTSRSLEILIVYPRLKMLLRLFT